MGKGSLLEILLSRKMRLSLILIIALVAVSGIHSEDNLENESGISKVALKSVSQDNIAQMDIEKEKREKQKREQKRNGVMEQKKGIKEKMGKESEVKKDRRIVTRKGAKKGKG